MGNLTTLYYGGTANYWVRVGYNLLQMPESEEKIIVSACLAGVCCNFKGEAAPNTRVIQLVVEGKAIPVCPEQLGGLLTPRTPAERRADQVITQDGQDVSKEFYYGAFETLRIAQEQDCRLAILKARSPSCGKGVIYDGSFTGSRVEGNGVTAELLLRNGIEVITEEEL